MGCWWMVRVSKQPKTDKNVPSIPPHQTKVSTQVWKAQCKKMACLCPRSAPAATAMECSEFSPPSQMSSHILQPNLKLFLRTCVRDCRKLLNEAFSFDSKGWLTHTISRRQRFKKAKFWNCFLLSTCRSWEDKKHYSVKSFSMLIFVPVLFLIQLAFLS